MRTSKLDAVGNTQLVERDVQRGTLDERKTVEYTGGSNGISLAFDMRE